VIDLHSHILPGVDDGSPDLEASLEMARMAVADRIAAMVCTPQIMPGLYHTTPADIQGRVADFQKRLRAADIPLYVVAGCEAHCRLDFVAALTSGQLPTLNGSRYVLFEPPSLVAPSRLEDLIFDILDAGFTPIVAHPEKLKWLETHYAVFERMVEAGAWLQVTAGSLTGRFGKSPQYWAEKLLDDGLVHVLATDARNATSRPPLLGQAYELARAAVGPDEALNLVSVRPANVLDDAAPQDSPAVGHLAKVKYEPIWLWPRMRKTG
jgi:protein-tyrosine phosphatase